MEDEQTYQEIIQKKCSDCYVNNCMLTPYAKAVMCLGPFKDLHDRLDKCKADDENNKPKSDFKLIEAKIRVEDYQLSKLLFEFRTPKDNPDEENK